MAPIHPRSTDSLIAELAKRVERLQSVLARGPILPSYTSTTLPASPPTGLEVFVADYGLRAWWNGTAWVYPPQLITKTVLAAPASSVRLPGTGSIPPAFTNLRLVASAKSDGTGSAGYDAAYMRYNGITAGNYSWNSTYITQGGTPTGAGATSVTSMQCGEIWNTFWGSAGRGLITLDIPDYADTANLKPFSGQSVASDGGNVSIQQSYSGCLGAGNTAAISSLTIYMGTGNFVAGSEFSLYGS